MHQNFFLLKKYLHWYILRDIIKTWDVAEKDCLINSQNKPKIQKDKEKEGVELH